MQILSNTFDESFVWSGFSDDPSLIQFRLKIGRSALIAILRSAFGRTHLHTAISRRHRSNSARSALNSSRLSTLPAAATFKIRAFWFGLNVRLRLGDCLRFRTPDYRMFWTTGPALRKAEKGLTCGFA